MHRFIRILANYFDLRPFRSGAVSHGLGKRDVPWLAQYIALTIGVLVQPYFQSYQATGTWQWAGFISRIPFSLATGLIILPAAYRRSFDPGTPGAVQFSTILIAGMGWQSLVPTALKAAQSVVGKS